MAADPTAFVPTRQQLPAPWLGHLLVFGLLFALISGWLFVQTRQAERLFLADAQARAQLLTEAVLLQARGALLAERVTADIVTRFLGNSAKFVSYLDGIAPFSADELSAFADEAGLSVIRLIRTDGTVQGPANWQPHRPLDCQHLDQLVRLPAAHTIALGIAADSPTTCVWVGLDSRHTEALEATIGLPRALAAVTTLPGVVAVQLDGTPRAEVPNAAAPLPQLTMRQLPSGRTVVHAVAPVAGATLQLDLATESLQATLARLWQQFLAFTGALSLAAGVGAWLLYRQQRLHQRQRLAYEQRLSQQREEASLGRAAAAIAHEIRNPLNAMAMGLQRLQLEAEQLTAEQRRLLEIVLAAVGRTNGTVTGLLEYARPVQPQRVRLALDELVSEQLTLYQHPFATLGVQVRYAAPPPMWVWGDADLLRQVLDNVLRNVLEATGVTALEITLTAQRERVVLRLANDGFALPASALPQLLTPWFTTKTTGTGLGLAISQRIIAAHGGQLTLTTPAPGWLCVEVMVAAGAGIMGGE